MSYIPRVVLVTGAAGFIGSHFVTQQLQHYPEQHIISLDLLTYAGNLDHLTSVLQHPLHTFIQGDIADTTLVNRLFKEFEIDSVVHFAAESHVDRSIATPTLFVHTNVLGTATLLEAAHTHWETHYNLDTERCRFHHISTDEVFGSLDTKDPPFLENSAYAPNSPYAATKAASDHLVRAYAHTYGLPITGSHCSNNYGPHQHVEKLIPTVIQACFAGRPIPIYGDGKNIRDWLYVTDHCDAVDRILRNSPNGVFYNIGGDCEQENITIIQQVCDILDQQYPRSHNHSYRDFIRFVADRPGHDKRYAIDHSKMTQTLQWNPKTSLQEGLKQTIQFYGEQLGMTS